MLRRRSTQVEDARADMTPCIDIVFNLLIFFLCATKLRATEGAIQAFLPKGLGPNASSVVLANDVRVKLLWLDDAGRPTTGEDGHVVVSLGARRLNAPGELDGRALRHRVWRDLHDQLVALEEAAAGAPMPVIIDARPQVPTQHVISALNEVVRAGLADVRFAEPEHE